MRKRFTHPSKSSEDNNYFQLKRGLFHTINQQFTHSLWTYTSTSYSLTLLNYHFVGMSSDTLSGKHVLRKSELLPPPGGGSSDFRRTCITAPPSCLPLTNPKEGRGGIGRTSKTGTAEAWHPPCPFQENQTSVQVAVKREDVERIAKHTVFHCQIPVDSPTLETLARSVVRRNR